MSLDELLIESQRDLIDAQREHIKLLSDALEELLNGCAVIAKHSGIDIEAECLAFVDSPFAKARLVLKTVGQL